MYKSIEKNIEDKIEEFFNPYKCNFHEFKINCNDEVVEVHVNETTEQLNRAIVLRAWILKEYKQVQITNIFMTESLRHKGLGKKLISLLFDIAQEYDYELFVVDMVPSFYEKLIKRGAIKCQEENDAVQITKNTKLY